MHARSWRCAGRTFDLGMPLIMGILNVTPDSFSDGGRYDRPAAALARGRGMVEEGAGLVDVGGESTRPGADAVDPAEELARVLPVVSRLAAQRVPVSVDTRRPDVARACVEQGACVINDVSGFRDPRMVELAASCDAGLVVMHMLGEDPRTMQADPVYDDVVSEVAAFLEARVADLRRAGVAADRIAIDPGIGFGKTLEHNIALLRGLPVLAALGCPIVAGVSRKRFIGAITGVDEPAARLAGSLAAALFAVDRGASVVRVHDVADTRQALEVHRALGGAAAREAAE